MINKTKKFTITVDVNIQALLLAYRGGDTSIQVYDLPPIKEIIEFEMGFVSASGIHVEKVNEVEKSLINITWHIEDVQGVVLEKFSKSISDGDALSVLEFVKNTHNAEVGINWEVIELAIEHLAKQNEITLVEVSKKVASS